APLRPLAGRRACRGRGLSVRAACRAGLAGGRQFRDGQPLGLGRTRPSRRYSARTLGEIAGESGAGTAHPRDALSHLARRRDTGARLPRLARPRRPGFRGPARRCGVMVARPPARSLPPCPFRARSLPGHLCRQHHTERMLVVQRLHAERSALAWDAAHLRREKRTLPRRPDVRVGFAELTYLTFFLTSMPITAGS